MATVLDWAARRWIWISYLAVNWVTYLDIPRNSVYDYVQVSILETLPMSMPIR